MLMVMIVGGRSCTCEGQKMPKMAAGQSRDAFCCRSEPQNCLKGVIGAGMHLTS